jgi:hypothetical protein
VRGSACGSALVLVLDDDDDDDDDGYVEGALSLDAAAGMASGLSLGPEMGWFEGYRYRIV